ncbi:MAG: glycosyltransferase family 4 protein, partial [Syntrophobacteraceae bacterium]|nr:glycosyltransferase family 4 protein [Syntrophobacteraceae bacterium]
LADHHIVNAEDLRTQLAGDFGVPRSRITVIPNGVDTDFFRPAPGQDRSRGKTILCPARLHPDKDHKTLVAAFRHVAAHHPQAELRIVGNGPHRDAVEGLVAASGLAHRIRLIPGQKDLRPLLWESDVVALSSIHEGLPNVILEAMACGLPVVATRVSGLPEVVEHGKTGLLVPRENPAALAAAVSCLLADQQLRESCGRLGRESALAKYSIRSMVESHEKVFTRLLG